jgi:Uncharacterized protein conserved in bacteria (DUF2252)
MNIHESTAGFEAWLRGQLADRGKCDAAALMGKHAAMRKEGAHAFLRGTFYRWAQLWQEVRDGGSKVAAAGDTHVENFGTWRDREGRLVWGVNDFDEACELPWTSDLVRLGVSAMLALQKLENFTLSADDACDAILDGYAQAVTSGDATPLVLAEKHSVLREFALKLILSKPPEKFWKKKEEKLEAPQNMPGDARTALNANLLDGSLKVEFLQPKPGDPPGMGSRGKRRFYALAMWKGAKILREAKPVVPSAMAWAKADDAGPGLAEMLIAPRRCPDPFQKIQGKWVVRRLAADSSKIELEDLAGVGADQDMERKVFESMGAEIGNLHLGSISAAKLRGELDARGADAKWLRKTAKDWTKKVKEDFAEFCRKDD